MGGFFLFLFGLVAFFAVAVQSTKWAWLLFLGLVVAILITGLAMDDVLIWVFIGPALLAPIAIGVGIFSRRFF